jgi:hypothetical protein
MSDTSGYVDAVRLYVKLTDYWLHQYQREVEHVARQWNAGFTWADAVLDMTTCSVNYTRASISYVNWYADALALIAYPPIPEYRNLDSETFFIGPVPPGSYDVALRTALISFFGVQIDKKDVTVLTTGLAPGSFKLRAKVLNERPAATYFGVVEVRPSGSPASQPALKDIIVRLIVP